jgi:hypothetical protein
MPSVMDERHEEIRSASISSDHLSEKPVLQPGGLAIPLELSVFIDFKMTSAPSRHSQELLGI